MAARARSRELGSRRRRERRNADGAQTPWVLLRVGGADEDNSR